MPPALPRRSTTLDSGPLERLVEFARSDRIRAVHVRRVAAATLAVAAVATALRGDPDSERVTVVVAAHDLTPGVILTERDVSMSDREAGSVAEGTQTSIDTVVGRTLAGPTRTGESLTDVRLLGPRLADAAAGIENARIVPVRLAEPGVAGLLREGDRVDVLTVAPETPDTHKTSSAAILAAGAVVVLVTTPENDRNQRERVIMLALPESDATRVAAASLTDAITVTFQ